MEMTNIKNKVEYTIASISEFARRHNLSQPESFRYLKRFKGLEMLDKFYDTMHTLSFKDTTDDLTALCHRNGGGLV